jgi:hypothetical protein
MLVAFRLGKTLQEMAAVDPEEIALWIAWFSVRDPERREDWRTGVIASTIANCHAKHRFTPQDFMPQQRNETSSMTHEQAEQRCRLWAAAANAGRESQGGV